MRVKVRVVGFRVGVGRVRRRSGERGVGEEDVGAGATSFWRRYRLPVAQVWGIVGAGAEKGWGPVFR